MRKKNYRETKKRKEKRQKISKKEKNASEKWNKIKFRNSPEFLIRHLIKDKTKSKYQQFVCTDT